MNPIERSKKYLNPYVGGVLLGLVLLAANFISGRGLGASGAIKSAVVASVNTVAPAHASSTHFYQEYKEEHPGNPLNSWLVFQMLGVVVGGFVSGAIAGRLKLQAEHHPDISTRRRMIFALAGGILFGFGSQMGRGCTSGSALSGMAVFSLQGFISTAAIFGTAYGLAYVVRRNWIGKSSM
jgi:uncharacterized membrane protein YedE/YeeE